MTEVYLPGTEEKDLKKVIMSLQAVGGAAVGVIDDVATNTADIVTNTSDIATLSALVAAFGASATSYILTGNVALNNTANYFVGPTITLPSTGTWVIFGYATLVDTAGAAAFIARLARSSTIFASSRNTSTGASNPTTIAIGAIISGTAADVINFECRDSASTSGLIAYDNSGNAKDSAMFGFRIA